jgi:hypothetical protein
MEHVHAEDTKRCGNISKTLTEREIPRSDLFASITPPIPKTIIATGQATATPKRSTIKSIRRIKHSTPYASSQSPIMVQTSRITLTQALKHKKIGRPPKKFTEQNKGPLEKETN